MLNKCKLCGEEKELKKSHSIPRTFFAGIKEDGKCVIVENNAASLIGNFDPKEPMLCGDCELFLSKEYESYGTRLFREYKNVSKYDNCVVFSNFKYEKYYLYLISILWRSSIAKDEHYTGVNLGCEIENLLRHCILRKKIKINDKGNFRLDNLIRISVYRITDSTKNISDEIIRNLLSNICIYRDSKIPGVTYYWICNGFVIFYHFFSGNDIHSARALKLQSQLTKGSHQKILKIEIASNHNLRTIFNNLITVSRENG